MLFKKGLVIVLLRILCAAMIFGMAGACSPAKYKAQADTEVYKIIDSKWDESLGVKANYIIDDVSETLEQQPSTKSLPSSGIINLAQAVNTATAHNRNYQTQKERLYLTALDLTLERHQFTRQWFGTFDEKYTNVRDKNKTDAGEKISYDAQAGFEQLLADGAAVSVGIALDWARFLTGDPRTSLGSVLSASVTVPLLRGAGRKIAQENLTQAERDVLYQIRTFNRFRKTFVVSVVTDYYRVLQQYNEVTNAQNNFNRRVELRERSELEAQTGRTRQFEVDQAQQRELDAKDRFVRAQQRYKQLLDEFKIRLALPTDADIDLDYNELKALEEVGVTELNYTPDAAVETALLQRLDLATSMDKIDDALRKVMVAADNLGAELNLIGSANAGSRGKTDFGTVQFHRGTYGLGLESDLPFDRKAERNAYRESLISLEQRQRDYDQDVDDIKLQVRQAYRQLEEEKERFRIQKNSLQLAQKRVESMPMLLKTERARTRDLLESQDALLQAQNDVTGALVAYAVAKLNFFRDIGILQVRPDGMWQQ